MPVSEEPADRTRRVQLPPEEAGPVPVTLIRAEPRWFGVPPPLLVLGLAVLCLVLAVVTFAVGSWPTGLVAVGLSALFAASFLEIARRRPGSAPTRASARAADAARSWASTRAALVRARMSALAETQRVLGARAVIESERRTERLRLGEALASEDEEAAAAARGRLEALERAEEALGARLEAGRARADERIRRIRLAGERTLVVPPRTPSPEPSPPRGEDTRRPAA